MFVPNYEHGHGEIVTLSASGEAFLSGGVGGWQEPEPKPETQRRRIGFRMPEPEPVIIDPSWMLL